jgi:hypothetical protein
MLPAETTNAPPFFKLTNAPQLPMWVDQMIKNH